MAKGLDIAFGLPLVNYKKLESPGENISECYDNAPKIPGEKFPLIMFSRGQPSYRESNSFLFIELASHGYVVISVAHSLEATCAEFDDGTAVFMTKNSQKKLTSLF